MPSLLYLLSAVNLVIGTSAFAPTGILDALAHGLGVGVPAAGQAMTAYALATAVLAPLALVFTGRWPRRRVLLLSMGVFAAGTALCALATNLSVLMAGRVLMGLGAAFTPAAAAIAIALVEPARRGQALALVFLGMSISYVVGLPLIAWMGLSWGWRPALGATAALSLAAWLALAFAVPREIRAPGSALAGMARVLRRADVLAALGLTLMVFVAVFCVFSYVGPVLQALVAMSPVRFSVTLSLFGLSGVAGTLLGGWATDRFGARRSLQAQLAVLGWMMMLLPLTAGHWIAMVVVMLVWGTAGFGLTAPQQSRLAAMAPHDAPLVLSLNASMLYFGTALGAALGGAASAAVGFARLSWVGAAAVGLGLLLLAWGPRGRAGLAIGADGRN